MFASEKMDSSVVLLLAAWHCVPSSLCPESTCLFDLQQCKKVSQLSKVYKVLHALLSMRTHVQPACGAAFVGVCGIKKALQLFWTWQHSALCVC